MSYNVDKWKTKKIEGLRIPLASFFKHARKDWHPDIVHGENGVVTLGENHFESIKIVGQLADGEVSVSFIECSGEGSGAFLNWILEPALCDSTGELEASTVWERGDTIKRLTVRNGDVKWEDIEI